MDESKDLLSVGEELAEVAKSISELGKRYRLLKGTLTAFETGQWDASTAPVLRFVYPGDIQIEIDVAKLDPSMRQSVGHIVQSIMNVLTQGVEADWRRVDDLNTTAKEWLNLSKNATQ